jgi:hypothetical protein
MSYDEKSYNVTITKHTAVFCVIKFQNRVLRDIFGPTKEEVTGGWRKFYDAELHGLYSSNIIRMIKWRRMSQTEHVTCKGQNRNVYTNLVGKHEWQEPLGGCTYRMEAHINLYRTDI